MMSNKIKVIETKTQSILFETSLEEEQKAYEHAAQMEEMGLEVKIVRDTIIESFQNSLGLSQKQLKEHQESVQEELHDHDGQEESCCFKSSTSP